MDSSLEKILCKRAENKQCIICAKDLKGNKTDTVVLEDISLGLVEICEKHIKSINESSTEDKDN